MPPDRAPGHEGSDSRRTVHIFGLILFAALFVPLGHNALAGDVAAVAALLIAQVLALAVLRLNHRGLVRAAGRLLCVSSWGLVTTLAFTGQHGSHDVALLGFPPVLMVAAILVDRRFFIVVALLVVGAMSVLHVAEIHGWIVNDLSRFTNYRKLTDYVLILGLTATAVWMLTADLRAALERARHNEAALAASVAETGRQAEALRRSEQRFRTAMELAAEGIVLGDSDNRVTAVNSEITAISGYTREELIGRPATGFFHPDDLQNVPLRWDDLDRGEVVTSERRLLRKDGSARLVETKSQRLPDGTLQCFVRDITARRELEEQLRQVQRMEAIGALAGGIAHDFNNLLTAMRGLIGTLESEQGLTGPMRSGLEDLRIVADRAADLTRQLLAFARRQPLLKEPADLRDVLTEVQRILRRLLSEQVELRVELPRQPCPVFVDRNLISQVVVNLAVNAADAMPRGGRLVLAASRRTVDEPPSHARGIARPGNHVCLSARDTGSGIDPAVRARIFEPFFTTKERGHGSGLGLAMVAGIIEQHSGWIEVDSEPGRGSEFRILLPEYPGRLQPRAPAAPPMGNLRGTERLLLVEDDPPVRRLAAAGLRHLGYTILEAGSGPEALRVLSSGDAGIAMLVTDMVMPGGMTGLELAEQLRARTPELYVIITSGYSQEGERLESLAREGMRFLPKPYDLPVLAGLIRSILDGRATGR